MSKQEGGEIGEEQEIEEEEQEIEESKTYVDNLIKKALDEGKEESKLTLELDEWVTLGSAVSTWSTITILYGEVEKVLLDSKYKYLMAITKTYVIIPKTSLVVLVYTSVSDFGGQLEYHTTLYVFFKSTGWKSLDIS